MITSLRQTLSNIYIVPHRSDMYYLRVMPDRNVMSSLQYKTGAQDSSVPSFRALRRKMIRAKEHGFKSILLYGGDPLCRSDLKEILQCAFEEFQFRTALSTDALMFDQSLFSSIIPYLHHLYLSLDSDNESISSLLRAPHQCSQTLLTLQDLAKTPIILDVATIATSLNKRSIMGVALALKDAADVWRLYRCLPFSTQQFAAANQCFLTEEDFSVLVEASHTALNGSSLAFQPYWNLSEVQSDCRVLSC